MGDRVNFAWLRHTCGHCRFCRAGIENLCAQPRFTGWDDKAGYAEPAVAHKAFAYRGPTSSTTDR
jgi:propanol-preferring alcohol dehydrogenase